MIWARHLVVMLTAFAMLVSVDASASHHLDEGVSASSTLDGLEQTSSKTSDNQSTPLVQALANAVSGGPDDGEDDPDGPVICASNWHSAAQSRCRTVFEYPADHVAHRRNAPFRARGPPMS